MKKQTLLITGGTGYIGSHAVVSFEQHGYETVILDNLSNSSILVLDGVEKILGYRPTFYECDIRDEQELRDIFSKHDFAGVVHFAGLKAVGESCKNPFEYYENNVVGSINLFRVMEEFSIRNILFSSTGTAYSIPSPFTRGLQESDTSGATTNPYSNSKYLIEQIINNLCTFSKWRGISLRYFNPIGAHPSGYIGENPHAIPNNLLPYIMKVAKGELETVQIFGTDYPTRDGTGIRDYIDINDLIEGHISAWTYLGTLEAGSSDMFNLGSGEGTSVYEILSVTEEVIGITLPKKICPRRTGDVSEFFCDAKKANKILKWVTKTSIKQSIESSYQFYIKHD